MSDARAPEAPTEVLSALSRLNIHARANGCGKRAIYAYKTFVACEFATEARAVKVNAKCHHCDGTGVYRDWDGCERGPCYRCVKGIATLRFVESAIGEFRWHHPFPDGGMNVLRSVWGVTDWKYLTEGGDRLTLAGDTERDLVWDAPADWAPNAPGAERLSCDVAAGLLNAVESWLLESHWTRPYAQWPLRHALDATSAYHLDLDRVPETTCWNCGDWPATHNLGRYDGRLHYARAACDTCAKTPVKWPTMPHPESMTPNIAAWLAHLIRQFKDTNNGR